MSEDTTRTCEDFNQPFTLTAEKLAWFASKGFREPTRCIECGQKRKAARDAQGGGSNGGSGDRPSFPINCTQCGKATTVPFKPRVDEATGKPLRPVRGREGCSQSRAQ